MVRTRAVLADKMTSADMLRMGEARMRKCISCSTNDIWSNFQADPQDPRCGDEKDRLKYGFAVYLAGWRQFTWPLDKDNFGVPLSARFSMIASLLNRSPFKSFL